MVPPGPDPQDLLRQGCPGLVHEEPEQRRAAELIVTHAVCILGLELLGGQGKQGNITDAIWGSGQSHTRSSAGLGPGRSFSASRASCEDPRYRLLGPHKVSSVRQPEGAGRARRPAARVWNPAQCFLQQPFLQVELGRLKAGIHPLPKIWDHPLRAANGRSPRCPTCM